MKNASLAVFCLGVALVLQAGCSGVSDAKLRNDLKQTGMIWHGYHDENKKGPANWDELIAYAKKTNQGADSIERVRDAKYELKFTGALKDAKGGMAETVLAEKPGGGPKIMLDGSVP